MAIRPRTLLLAAIALVAVIAYIVVFVVVNGVGFDEETFTSAPIGMGAPLDVYLDVTAVDPVRESMDVRLDVANGRGTQGTHYGGTSNRDVELHVSDGYSEQYLRLRRNGPLSSTLFAAGLEGALNRYPFDRYSTRIVVSAIELSSKNGSKAIPVRTTVWEGVPAWALSVTKTRRSDAAGQLTLAFGLQRPSAMVFFACVLYGLMMLIAISAITIGSLVFVGMRRLETTLLGALAAMTFALPIMRNILPGAPPLGVIADILVLLWAELVVAIGLTLFVMAWVRRGSKP